MADGEINFDVDVDVKALLDGFKRAQLELTTLLNTTKELTSQRNTQAKQSEQYQDLLKKENDLLHNQKQIVENIDKLRKQHKSTAAEKASLQQTNAAISASADAIKRADRIIDKLSRTQAIKDVEGSPAPRSGGTYADARDRQKLASLQILDINSTTEQLEIKVRDAASKATERLIKSTASVISARLNKAAFDADSLIKGFGEPSSLKAKTNKRNILAELENEKYGDVADLAQFRAKEAAIKLEKQQRAAALKLEAEKLEMGRHLAEGMASSYSMTTRMASASSPLQQTKQGSNRPAPGSPEAAAAGFENRLRIFADYATIGTAVIGIKSILQSVTELDDGLKQFQAITRTTDTELAKFKDTLLDIGSSSRFSLKDLTELATVLGQTGLAAADVAKTIPSVIDLATASGSTIKQTTEVFTTAFGAFQMQASQAPDVANTIAEALNQTKLSVEQLSQGLSYSANIAAESGISFSELTAAIAGLSQAGIKSGSTAGTGIRQLLQELNAPTEKLVNVMNQLGITSQDVSVKANGFIGVLENLKEKGFGTSEALRSLDLRAASAFTALTSRTDRIKAYQESMSLSNAATEGAAKASESLNATWTRVGNTAQALASKALDPLITTLIKLGDLLASVGKSFEGFDHALPILGTAGVALAGGFGVSGVVKMGEGVFALANAFKAAETGAAGFGLVLAAIGKSPLLLALGIGAGIGAAYLFSGKNELAKRIEESKEALNGLQSRQAQGEASIASLDKAIGNLIEKRGKLNSDEFARREVILQAQKDFHQLGLDVDLSSTSIDTLITALQGLRGELQKQLPTNFALQITALRKLIQDTTSSTNEKDANIAQRLLYNSGQDNFSAWSSRGNNEKRMREFVQSRFQNTLDPTMDFLFTGSSKLNYKDSFKTGSRFSADLNRQRAELANKIDAGDKSEETQSKLKLADQLLAAVGEKMAGMSNLQSLSVQSEQLVRDENVSRIQATETFAGLKKATDDLMTSLHTSKDALLSDPLLKTDNQAKLRRSQEIQTQVTGQAGAAEAQIAEAERTFGKSFSADIIKTALTPLKDEIATIKEGMTGDQIDIRKFSKPGALALNKSAMRELDAERKMFESKIKMAGTTEEIDAISKQIIEGMNKQRDLEIEKVKINSEILGKLTETEQEQINTIGEKNAESIEKLETDMNAKRKELNLKMVEQHLAALKEDHILLNARHDKLKALRRVTEPSDVERIQQLETEKLTISAAIAQNEEQQANTEATKERLQASNFDFNSVEAKIANAATEKGGAQFIRYLLGLANAESSMGKKLTKPNSSAKGLFQFMPDTWKNTGGGDINDIATQVRNVLKLMQDDFVAFRNKFNRAPDDNELYFMHQQGQRAAMALLDPENANRKAADVIADAGGKRRAVINSGNKNADILAKDFVELVKHYFDKNAKTNPISEKDINRKLYAATNTAKEKQEARDIAIDAEQGYIFPGMSNGIGSSMMAGSNAFFKSSGMLNANKDFKSFNETIADTWGQTMGVLNNSMSQFFLNWANGTTRGKDAFLGFAQSVIASMMQIASQTAANQVMRGLFGGQMVNNGTGDGYVTGGLFGSAFRYITGAAEPTVGAAGALAIPTFSTGGFVRFADGGATANRDSIPALLMPGEYVLRKSAVDVIGRDRLDQVNALGSTRISQSRDAAGPSANAVSQPSVTNIWVVSPDQVPPPSERDIIVTVARDIQNRGSIRQLIQSVATGAA